MAKTFIYIFSFLGATYIIPDSISKRELSELRQVCIESYRNKNYKEAIPSLEKYLSFKNEEMIRKRPYRKITISQQRFFQKL